MKRSETIPQTIHFPKKLKHKLSRDAKEQRRSLQQHVVYILETYVDRARVSANDAIPVLLDEKVTEVAA